MHVGDPLSLALLGTLRWSRDDVEELLVSPDDVRSWCTTSGLELTVSVRPADVARVREVREALYRIVFAARTGTRPSGTDVTLLNEVVEGMEPQLRLTPEGRIHRTASVAHVLAVVVQDGLEMLARGEAARLRECDDPHCRRLFLSDPRTARRYCEMFECGISPTSGMFRKRRSKLPA